MEKITSEVTRELEKDKEYVLGKIFNLITSIALKSEPDSNLRNKLKELEISNAKLI